MKGRTFSSLREQNDHLLHWETTVADTRIHGTTQQQVLKFFRERERPSLQSLPLERFPCFQEGQRMVSRDGHVAVDKSYYSVPPEYLGRTLWVRWDSRLVRMLNDRMEVICTHATQPPGTFSTLPEHIASEKISPVERGTEWLLEKVSYIGPNTRKWSHGLVADTGRRSGPRAARTAESIEKASLAKLLKQACETAHSYQRVSPGDDSQADQALRSETRRSSSFSRSTRSFVTCRTTETWFVLTLERRLTNDERNALPRP